MPINISATTIGSVHKADSCESMNSNKVGCANLRQSRMRHPPSRCIRGMPSSCVWDCIVRN